ncbi:hypothetical protein FB45DRAFT_748384 [Roridomyces roridus]|uniref:Zn(2)-C6 fungal-type domain-containing protein n=1 Tax=Roridomyces roridus TaxID=1738132 RepID=A0AAD7BR32_9AGAR|nr:hypothetical protein FB45DRAFT_748384 [Roridomyces roridus]
MKRSREKEETRTTTTKKPKSIQACSSCRKHKTRCEILDPSKSPVKCHRCQVLSLQCSYEDTLLPTAASIPTASTSKCPSPDSPPSDLAQPPTAAHRSAALRTYPATMPPTDRMWSFVSDQPVSNWSAPMLAIQHLSKIPLPHLPAQTLPQLPPGDFTLPQILSEERICYLLELFDERYTPWLNFKPTKNTNGSLLHTVCCAVASRHLDSSSGGTLVKMQLQKLAEDSIAKMILNPRPSDSMETIQALLILSLWPPLGGAPEEEGRDGRLLIASAVSMAMNLRLNQASEKVFAMRKANEDPVVLEEMLENARLWIALTNTESVLCAGTGRIPLSKRSPEDLRLIEFPEDFDDVHFGDVRLTLTAESFDLLEKALTHHITDESSPAEVDSFYDEIMIPLEKMKRIKRLLMPLPFVLEREQFYFHILHIYRGMARLLVLYHALWDARRSVGKIPLGQTWHPYFKPHGVEAVGDWGRDVIITVEELLTCVLGADAHMLSTSPDNIFRMITLAAGYLVAVKFLMLRGATVLTGASDLVLAKIVSLLNQAACAPGHPAQRAAFLITGMIAQWESRSKSPPPQSVPATSTMTGTSSYPTPSSDFRPLETPPPSGASPLPPHEFYEPSAFAAGRQQQQPLHYQQHPTYDQYGMPDVDFSAFLDSTIPVDAEFWNNLAQTHIMPGYH